MKKLFTLALSVLLPVAATTATAQGDAVLTLTKPYMSAQNASNSATSINNYVSFYSAPVFGFTLSEGAVLGTEGNNTYFVAVKATTSRDKWAAAAYDTISTEAALANYTLPEKIMQLIGTEQAANDMDRFEFQLCRNTETGINAVGNAIKLTGYRFSGQPTFGFDEKNVYTLEDNLRYEIEFAYTNIPSFSSKIGFGENCSFYKYKIINKATEEVVTNVNREEVAFSITIDENNLEPGTYTIEATLMRINESGAAVAWVVNEQELTVSRDITVVKGQEREKRELKWVKEPEKSYVLYDGWKNLVWQVTYGSPMPEGVAPEDSVFASFSRPSEVFSTMLPFEYADGIWTLRGDHINPDSIALFSSGKYNCWIGVYKTDNQTDLGGFRPVSDEELDLGEIIFDIREGEDPNASTGDENNDDDPNSGNGNGNNDNNDPNNGENNNGEPNNGETANETAQWAGVKVYPNPSNGTFQVQVPAPATVEIYAANGMLVESAVQSAGVRTYTVNRSGLYFIRIADGENGTVKRVVVR